MPDFVSGHDLPVYGVRPRIAEQSPLGIEVDSHLSMSIHEKKISGRN